VSPQNERHHHRARGDRAPRRGSEENCEDASERANIARGESGEDIQARISGACGHGLLREDDGDELLRRLGLPAMYADAGQGSSADDCQAPDEGRLSDREVPPRNEPIRAAPPETD
jgi:hypothetical protein